jgi:hypothetical protein
LNRKLGYEEVRCGPIWDEVPRVSLGKWLKPETLVVFARQPCLLQTPQ